MTEDTKQRGGMQYCTPHATYAPWNIASLSQNDSLLSSILPNSWVLSKASTNSGYLFCHALKCALSCLGLRGTVV